MAATDDDEFAAVDSSISPLTGLDAGADAMLDADLMLPDLPIFQLPDGSLDASVDASRPDAGRDASLPDASRPDASQPDASRPDASQPDASRPDSSLPDASSQPDANSGGSCKVDSCPACSNGNERCCVSSNQCGCKYILNSVCLPI